MKTSAICAMTIRTTISWLLVLSMGSVTGQKKQGFIPPSIDDEDIPVVKTELLIPVEGEDYVVKYFKGTTDGIESRIAVKKLGYILRPAMVQVFSEDGRELAIELVKKDWDDIVRSGSTENGTYSTVFRTAMEFGIKINAVEKGIPFVVAVSAGVELFPSSNLFVDAATMRQNNGGPNNQEAIGPEKIDNSGNLFYIVIIGVLMVLVLVLVLFFYRKKSSGKAITVLFVLTSTVLSAEIVPHEVGQSEVGKFAGNLTNSLAKFYGSGNFEKFDLLGADDANHEPNMDPRGQPSLPSSCYNIAMISQSESSSNSGGGSQGNNNRGLSQNTSGDTGKYGEGDSANTTSTQKGFEQGNGTDFKALSSSDQEIESPLTGESHSSRELRLPKYDEYGNLENPGDYPDAPIKYDPDWSPPENPFTGESHTSREPRLPKYDEYGNLNDAGDFPNAPTKYNPNWSPPENPFTGESYSSREPRLPKYDEYGNLKDAGDYPDAPIKYDSNWSPRESPFVDGPSERGTFTRIPKYDKEGHLLDSGDYPQAPKEIDPSRVNDEDYILEQMVSSSDDKSGSNISPRTLSGSRNTAPRNSGGNSSGNVASSSGRDNNGTGDPRESSESNEEGCTCLERAYSDLQHNRYTLEKLLKIAQHTKKATDFGISFGDNFSGIHAVSGLAWQKERLKILKTIEKFDKSYEIKYNELMDHLYGSLMKIDECEKKLGFENWYSQSGFIYYEFMKVRYASYK